MLFSYFTVTFSVFLFFVPCSICQSETDAPSTVIQEDTTPVTLPPTLSSSTTHSTTTPAATPGTPFSIEILGIHVPPGVGNAVRLVWGTNRHDRFQTNFTYGVHYGLDDGELIYPKMTSNNLSATVEDLEFCTKYLFAVTVVEGAGDGEAKVNPNDVRSVVTGVNLTAPPKDLQVEYEPRAVPCLQIKWSASCANIGQPIGYVISAFENTTSRHHIIPFPETRQADLVYNMRAQYGDQYAIKVSTNYPGSEPTRPAAQLRVPRFLQPFRTRVAANGEDGAFMIYWSEPYVPPEVGRYYYEVRVYRGTDVSTPSYERYYVTRPVMVYKGEASAYAFSVGLVSNNQRYRSPPTNPVAADLSGNTRELEFEEENP